MAFHRSVDTFGSEITLTSDVDKQWQRSLQSQASTSKLFHATAASEISLADALRHEPSTSCNTFRRQSHPKECTQRAWLQVFAGFLLFMNTWGIINAFGVFQTYYSSTLLADASESEIAWIGTSTSFLLCASPVIWGPIFDLGYARLLVTAGSASIVFGIMMTSLCHTYWQLILAQGVCVGIGGGCAFVTAVSILPAYFSDRRALAMGVAASGSSLGGILYPIIFHQLQPRIGFGWAVRAIGLVAAITLSVPCVVLRPRSQSKAVRKIFEVTMLKDLDFQLINIATFLGFVGQYIPFFFIQTYASSHGLSLAFWMLIFLNIGSLPGRIVPGLVADKLRMPMPVLSICATCSAILAFCWIGITHSTAGLVVWALLYGFFSGALVSLQGPAVASMTTDMSRIGTKFGFNMFCGALGTLIGSPVGGAILPRSWAGTQAFCGTTLLLSAAVVVITDWHWRKYGRPEIYAK